VTPADPSFPRLKTFLIESTGLAYYADKDRDLADRVGRRLARLGMRACAPYLELLQDGPAGEAELDALIGELTIGETYFFRHPEQFAALGQVVLPALLAQNQHTRRLHVWSAGCATGAELYSLAILLRRELGPRLAGWELRLIGTDINREFLARAREGRFEEWAFRGVPEEVKQGCFARAGKSYLLLPQYREGVAFQYHNLVRHPFPSLLHNLAAFDLILCRNVAIYFGLETTRRVIAQFGESLVEGGWLVTGHAEGAPELFGAFRAANTPGGVFYQKSRAVEPAHPFPEFQAPLFPAAPPAWSPPLLPEVPALAKEQPALPPAADQTDLALIRGLADRGKLEEADRCCESLLDQDRLNPALHFYHALILEQKGRVDQAEQALHRALYLDRGFVLAHYHLGLLLQQRGRGPAAGRSFANTLRLLSALAPSQVFAEGDGMNAAELRELAQAHLEILGGGA
jgi:chemotaxis protein methyltransferase CheR